jgi:hypothetical protein
VLKHCAANRKIRLSTSPNVGPNIYDKISGFTRSYIYIHDISRLRVNGARVQFPAQSRNSPPLNVHTNPVAHPITHSMDTGVLLRG